MARLETSASEIGIRAYNVKCGIHSRSNYQARKVLHEALRTIGLQLGALSYAV